MAVDLSTLDPLLGAWEGRATGAAGEGVVTREYRRSVGDRFVEVRHRSTYEPQEANPEGEVHEEAGFFYDSGDRVVFIELHSEGFVIHYSLVDSDPITFVSDRVDNGPPGLRARSTLHLESPNRLFEAFELATGDGPFEEFITSRWERT